MVDTRRGEVIRNLDAKREVAGAPPVRTLGGALHGDAGARSRHECRRSTAGDDAAPRCSAPSATASRTCGSCSSRWAAPAADPVWSMGDDTPIPPLSAVPQSLYAYFRQRFAQVTNPPIDSLRETMVMSLRMHLGRRGSPLLERAVYARMLRLEHPDPAAGGDGRAPERRRLLDRDPRRGLGRDPRASDGLRPALTALRRAAERAARRGARILVISDRAADERQAPDPDAARHRRGAPASGAHRAARAGRPRRRGGRRVRHPPLRDADRLRRRGGAPLARAGVDGRALRRGARAVTAQEGGEAAEAARPSPEEARRSYRSAAEKGLLKILSKMGISTLSSYCGAQIFEVLGLGHEVIETCFAGTASPIGGIGFEEIAEDVLARHRAAYPADEAGRAAARSRPGALPEGRRGPRLGAAGRGGAAAGGEGAARARTAYARVSGRRTRARRPAGPRDLLDFRRGRPGPLDEVEPVEAIRRRFISSAMSLGALSPEAHATLSIAMNRMGARSNSGEGGEDPQQLPPASTTATAPTIGSSRWPRRASASPPNIWPGPRSWRSRSCRAPSRAKAASSRHTRSPTSSRGCGTRCPGIQLISPPPHHDIYSIEDLAQLIHDLKTVNPRARVGVKLVAETGVGTVAAGVAKAYADYVLIAGHNGGTGASPLSSIKHAGSPWELGLAEAQHTLVRNGLRHRIEVRTDGGLKTGRDVVIAALLGAESYGFGTAPLVAMGCAMARQCHLNTCPTGIATQREDLRAKFKGTPEQVITYFTLLAEEVREILAGHGRSARSTRSSGGTICSSGSSGPTCRERRCSICRSC